VRTFLIVAFALGVFAAPAYAATPSTLSIQASSTPVRYGAAVTLSGRLSDGLAHQPIAVFATAWGHPPARIASTRTGANGVWSIRARPTILTTYAAFIGQTRSKGVIVGVEPRITVRVLRGGTAEARVAPAIFPRRTLELQHLSAGAWRTIATTKIGAGSLARFPAFLARGAGTLRVAMSVNQAGKGYLGTASAPFVGPAP
jgi:hypothetical protein